MRLIAILMAASSVAALTAWSAVAAEAAPNPPAPDASQAFSLGEIVVTAPKVQGVQVDAATLSATAIQAYGATRLDDAVNLLPGVNSSNTGGPRNERLIEVRGFNRFQVPLLIDGIRVYLPADNRLDFGRFLTSDIAEVQVAKGYVSVLDGPGGMAGEINLVTRKPVKALEAEAGGEVELGRPGEYDGYTAYGLLGTRQDKWYAQISGTEDTQDHYDLSSAYQPTAVQPADERKLSKTTDWRGNLKIGYTPNATDEYSLSYTKQEGSKLAPFSVSDPVSLEKDWAWPYWNLDSLYFLSSTALGDAFTLKTKAYHNTFFNLLRAFDNANENTQTLPKSFNSYYGDEGDGGEAQVDWKASGADSLSVNVSYRRDLHAAWEQVFPTGFMQPRVDTVEDTYSIAAQNVLQIRPSLTLTVGASYDWRHLLEAQDYSNGLINYPLADGSAPNGQARLDWQVDNQTQIYGFVSSRERFPTIFERFSTQFGGAVSNPNLKAERATNFELGGSRNFGVLHAEGAVFYSRLDNAIFSAPFLYTNCVGSVCSTTAVTQSRNIGNGNYYGAELSLSARINAQLTAGGNVTWIQQDLKDPASAIFKPTDVPTDKLVLYADWSPIQRLHILPNLEIDSDRWTVNTAGTQYFRIGAFSLLDARVAYDFPQGVELAVGARNLLDQNYQLVAGFPEAGRSLFVSVRAAY